MTTLLLAIPVLLLGALLALALRDNRQRWLAAVATQALATVLTLLAIAPVLAGGEPLSALQPWPLPIGDIPLHVDGLSAFFLAWSLPMTLLGTVYARGYLAPWLQRGRNGGPHFALLNLTSLSFVLIYSVQNALVFLLGWEVAAVAAWLLVIWDYGNQKVRFAGFNYLVSTHVGMFVLVAAFLMLHSGTGSLQFAGFAGFLPTAPQRAAIFLLLGVAFALKSAFFPFHTWLPRAHAAAPAHVSALMSGVIHKAGLFGFLRFVLLAGKPDEWMGWSMLAFGALSAFFGALYTATQRDLKRLLGYSSTENVGIAAMGFGLGCLGWTWGAPGLQLLGFAGGLLHVLNHAVFKCLLFYAAGAVHHAAHTVDIERLGGLCRQLPRTAALFFVGALAIAALPPGNGFLSEFLIYCGAFAGAAPNAEARIALIAAAAVLAFVGGVGALAMTRAFGLTFLGVPREPALPVAGDARGTMAAAMLPHALLVVAIGLFPELALLATDAALRAFPGAADPGAVRLALAPVVLANRLLAGGLLLALGIAVRRGRAARRAAPWGCGYTAITPRMQYTGSAFAEQFVRVFASLFVSLRRQRLPHEPFPQQRGHLSTHVVDAVERRIFEVLGRGEQVLGAAAARLSEQPRVAFAIGLVVLVAVGAVVLGGDA